MKEKLKSRLNSNIKYFKTLVLVILVFIILINIAFYHFFSGLSYFLIFAIGNGILSWVSIIFFVWMGKNRIVSEAFEVKNELEQELEKQANQIDGEVIVQEVLEIKK